MCVREYVIEKLLRIELPCNEKNFAFLAVLMSDEIKIIDSIAALVGWERRREIVIRVTGATEFLYHNLLVIDLEYDISIVPLCF